MSHLRIDAHQHFWIYDGEKHPWITDDKSVLKRNFLPADLGPVLEEAGLNGCVAVQAAQSEEENEFLLSLAAKNAFIKGIVGWVDLRSDGVEERLRHYSPFPLVKGFRHVIHDEPDPGFMLQPAFLNGIALLKKFGFTYDVLIFHHHLRSAAELVARFPEQPFVIDHIAKPDVKGRQMAGWKKDIEAVAQYPNVHCKISGMVTEGDWKGWKKEDFFPYLDVIATAFGADRIMYGSDWPVCQLAASYNQQLSLVQDYFSSVGETENEKIFGGNAIKFYNLSTSD